MTEAADSQDPGLRPRPRFDPLPEWAGPSTRLVHGARRPEYNAGAVVPPIYQSTTYHFPSEFSEAADRGGLYLYSRLANPTVEVPAELLRQLEGGEAARLFGSGMGAFTSLVLSLVQSGDEVVALDVLYGGTLSVLADVLPRFGVSVRFVSEPEAREPEAVLSSKTRLAVIESPTNPLLTVHDIARWGRAADAVGAILVVDNTFATPINQNPLALGADLVFHSATKYLGGHSDLVAGGVVGPKDLLSRIDAKGDFGSSLDPFAAYLLGRSLKTLALRVARHNENGRRVADALTAHPLGTAGVLPRPGERRGGGHCVPPDAGQGGHGHGLLERWGRTRRTVLATAPVRPCSLQSRRGRQPRERAGAHLAPTSPSRGASAPGDRRWAHPVLVWHRGPRRPRPRPDRSARLAPLSPRRHHYRAIPIDRTFTPL